MCAACLALVSVLVSAGMELIWLEAFFHRIRSDLIGSDCIGSDFDFELELIQSRSSQRDLI